MFEIEMGKELLLENLITFRGFVTQNEMSQVLEEIEEILQKNDLQRKETPVTVTYEMKEELIDIEILIPVEGDLSKINNDKFRVKNKIRIVNAVVIHYIGNPNELQVAYNELNKYIFDNGLNVITAGYNVTKKVSSLDINNTEIEIYVGINPNIL